MMRLFFAFLSSLLLSSTMCAAADETLPFGLDKLRWNMTEAQVAAAFAPLRSASRRGQDSRKMYELQVDIKNHAWQACSFDGSFDFSKTGLSTIVLTDRGGNQACAAAALSALKADYGAGDTEEPHEYYKFRWQTPITMAKYFWWGEGGLYIALYQIGGPAVPDASKR